MRLRYGPTALLIVCACLPAAAHAGQSVRLRATFTPERLGEAATVGFDIAIAGSNDQLPAPLGEVTVRYPLGLDIGLSELGLDACPPARLEASGPRACPADSRMGEGSAVAEIELGPEVVRETARIVIVRAPEREGRLAMLFYVDGTQPVIVKAAFLGQLLPAALPFGGALRIELPPIASLPGSDAAVVRLHLVLGPPGLTYYERVRGKSIAYHPKGIRLPSNCPRGGFRFSAGLGFLDGSRAQASTTVRCPSRAKRG